MSLLTRLWEVVKLPGESRARPPADVPRAMVVGWDEYWGDVSDTVTPGTAIRNMAVLACVRVLAESVASLPLKVYRRTAKGKSEATDHPLYRLLHAQPNSELTSFEWRELMMANLLLWGNAYAEIEMSGRSDVLGIWPIRPDRVEPTRDKEGKLEYIVRSVGGGIKTILPAWRMLHVRGLGPDGIVGYSPITLARQAIGLSIAGEKLGVKFFDNGASPGGVLEHPGKLSDKAYEQLLSSWENRHRGVDNINRVAVLEEGMKWQAIGMPLDDAQFLETRKYQLSEVARLYRVPPHMIQDLDRATFSNIEHQAIQFVVDSLTPWLVRIEQAFTRDLFGVREREQVFAEFNVAGRMRGDLQTRYTAYSIGRQWGWLSRNDVRRMENMDTIEGGDDYLTPMNMTAVGDDPPEPKAAPAAEPPDRMVARAWIGDVCERIHARAADRDPKHRQWLVDVLRPMARASGSSAPGTEAEELADWWLREGTADGLRQALENLFD